MIYESTYKAAKTVASTVQAHFAWHLEQARSQEEADLAPEPDTVAIEAIIDAAFWASLRREEGHAPRISIAFLPPEEAGKPLLFAKPLALNPGMLTKLAPGVERPGIHLGVWYQDNQLYVWGTTQVIPNLCFVLDVSEPGLLVIKHRRVHGFGKYTNVAVLKGDQVKVVDERCALIDDSPAILKSLLGYGSPELWNGAVNVLIQLAVSMRAHKHGGTLLIVPDNDNWRSSIIHPMQYPVAPAFTGLADLCRQDGNASSEIFWQSALRREVDNIGGLTAVDGATIISNGHELLAFGAKIGRAEGSSPADSISLTEPILGGDAIITHPAQIGGTRHLSAAQFVFEQRNALAFVASQDGHFTIFSWSATQNILQAHRIETLLL